MGLTAFRVGLLSLHVGTSDNADYRQVPTRRETRAGDLGWLCADLTAALHMLDGESFIKRLQPDYHSWTARFGR